MTFFAVDKDLFQFKSQNFLQFFKLRDRGNEILLLQTGNKSSVNSGCVR